MVLLNMPRPIWQCKDACVPGHLVGPIPFRSEAHALNPPAFFTHKFSLSSSFFTVLILFPLLAPFLFSISVPPPSISVYPSLHLPLISFSTSLLQLPGTLLPQTWPTDGSPAGNNDPRQTLKLIMPSQGHTYKEQLLQWKMAECQKLCSKPQVSPTIPGLQRNKVNEPRGPHSQRKLQAVTMGYGENN